MKENNLPRSLVLKRRKDIVDLLATGIRFDGSCVRIVLLTIPDQKHGKVAFLVNKRLARKANLRVKIKRWLRELFRMNKDYLPLFANIALSVRIPYKNLIYRDLANDFNSVINSKEFVDFCSQSLPATIVPIESR